MDGPPEDQDHYGLFTHIHTPEIMSLFQLADGIPGLELARLADLPADVLAEGKRIAVKLDALDAQQMERSRTTRIAERRKALLRVLDILLSLLNMLVFASDDYRNAFWLLEASDAAQAGL